MDYKTIAEVYEVNEKIRVEFLDLVSSLSDEQLNLPTENGKWTIGKVVEHLAKAEGGMMKVAFGLLSKAKDEGKASDGSICLSENFITGVARLKEEKFVAPDIVQPEGGQPISNSIETMKQTRAKLVEMRPLFERFDGNEHSFPHPAFGDITANDWLVLIGGHEARHLEQIKRILAEENG